MKPTLITKLIGSLVYPAIVFGLAYSSDHKMEIKKEIYSHLEKMSENTDKSLIELTSKELTFNNKTYLVTAYPGFLGTPCSNILMQEYYLKINKE